MDSAPPNATDQPADGADQARVDLWGDQADDDQDEDDDGSASRGETPDHGEDREQPAPATTAEPAPPAAPVVLPRQQDDDPLRPPPEPYLRGLGRYDLIHNAATLLGSGWDLVGWSRAPACSTSARTAARSAGSSTTPPCSSARPWTKA
ncbi:hypothetical protein AB0A71_04985 [Kitasatospora aureofaciens]|uniref:hypothetical protein n=1 Tax=Kitasatospora aureofaciens TaxID=1894 RepID=UPI0033FE680D